MNKGKDVEFILSDVNGRFDHLLCKADYNSLSQCRTFEDFVIKLNHYFPFINESMSFTVRELRSKLYDNIIYELNEFTDKPILFLEYFIEYNKIQAFFCTLETGSDAYHTSTVNEFQGLSSCRTPKEAEKLYIRNTSLEKYFLGVSFKEKAEENDMQEMLCHVLKQYFDFYYGKIETGYFKEIMEIEGDRQIIEICLNGKLLKNKIRYFPLACTLSAKMQLQLNEVENHEDTKYILSPGGGDPISVMIHKQLRVYSDSFKQYNDLACLYAYFRLKEQEMSNILWIAECIVQDNHECIHDYAILEED